MMPMILRGPLGAGLLAFLLASACSTEPAGDETAPPVNDSAPVEALSLLGEDLRWPQLPESFVTTQEDLLAEARAALEAAPDDPEAVVWVGRRTAYLGRYREAIDSLLRRHQGPAAMPSPPRLEA